nr:spidroin-2-like [Aegilops tauschii subsp. strangulata]
MRSSPSRWATGSTRDPRIGAAGPVGGGIRGEGGAPATGEAGNGAARGGSCRSWKERRAPASYTDGEAREWSAATASGIQAARRGRALGGAATGQWPEDGEGRGLRGEAGWRGGAPAAAAANGRSSSPPSGSGRGTGARAPWARGGGADGPSGPAGPRR